MIGARAHQSAGAIDQLCWSRAHQRGVDLLEAAGCEEGVNTSRYRQARLARAQGDSPHALALAVQSLRGYRVLGHRRDVPSCLDLIDGLIVHAQPAAAAKLFAAAGALRASMAVRLPPADRASHEAGVAAARAALGESGYSDACALGAARTHEARHTRAAHT